MASARKQARGRRVKRRPAEGVTSLAAANKRVQACERRITALQAQLAQLEAARAAERGAARRRMARARRQYEARLTLMVQEIGQLRHHEARARALERALAAKERELARATAPRDR